MPRPAKDHKVKGVVFDVTNSPRPKRNVEPIEICYANQRHIEVCQELTGDYTIIRDTADVYKTGDIIDHEIYSALNRVGFTTIVDSSILLLEQSMPHEVQR